MRRVKEVFGMSRESVILILIAALYLGGVSGVVVYSKSMEKTLEMSEVVPIKENSSEDKKIRVVEKKYMEEFERGEKRYVGDAAKEEVVEGSRRRGRKKRYVGEKGGERGESEEEFFKEQKDSSFKYDYEEIYVDEKIKGEFFKEEGDSAFKYGYEKSYISEESMNNVRVKWEEKVDEEEPEEKKVVEKIEPQIPEREKGRRAKTPKVEIYKD